jgi:hypothetical protein
MLKLNDTIGLSLFYRRGRTGFGNTRIGPHRWGGHGKRLAALDLAQRGAVPPAGAKPRAVGALLPPANRPLRLPMEQTPSPLATQPSITNAYSRPGTNVKRLATTFHRSRRLKFGTGASLLHPLSSLARRARADAERVASVARGTQRQAVTIASDDDDDDNVAYTNGTSVPHMTIIPKPIPASSAQRSNRRVSNKSSKRSRPPRGAGGSAAKGLPQKTQSEESNRSMF